MSKAKLFLVLACAFIAALWQQPHAKAQAASAIIVSSCGTAPFTYTAGQVQPIVQDVNGNTCTGASGSHSFQLAPAITVQNAAYSAGNSEGGLVTLTGAARINGGTGTVVSLRLKSTGGSTNTIWVYAWSKTPAATCTDKAAYVASASDNPYSLPGFPVQVTLGGSPGAWDTATYAQVASINSVFKNQDASPGTAVYFCMVTAAAVTPLTISDLSMVVGGLQD